MLYIRTKVAELPLIEGRSAILGDPSKRAVLYIVTKLQHRNQFATKRLEILLKSRVFLTFFLKKLPYARSERPYLFFSHIRRLQY